MKYPYPRFVATATLAATAALFGLAGCTETTGGTQADSAPAAGTPTLAEQGCLRDVTRQTNNPDVVMLSSSDSEAGTEVIVGVGPQRARWRCIGYSDGAVGELTVVDAADDGGGAMAGAPQISASPEPSNSTQRIRFQRGESGVELTGTLSPGSSARYVLGAKKGQNLYVRVAPRGGASLDYQIFNPDQSFLLDQISTNREYRGQLWQSGDHVVEVINRGNDTVSYNLIVGID